MSASDVAIVAAVIFLWGALSARMERYDVTAPIIFVGAANPLAHRTGRASSSPQAGLMTPRYRRFLPAGPPPCFLTSDARR